MKKLHWFKILFLSALILILIRLINQTEMLGVFFDTLWKVAAPLLSGMVLAFIMDPVVGRLQRFFHLPRLVAIIITALAFAFIILIGLLFFLPSIIAGLRDMAGQIPVWIDRSELWLADFQFSEMLQQWEVDEILRSNAAQLNVYIHTLINNVISSSLTLILTTTSALFSFLFTCLAAIFFLLDKDNVLLLCRRLVVALCEKDHAVVILDYATRSKKLFYQFIVGKVIQAAILTATSSIGFFICGVPYAVLIGLFVGVTNIIPYVGPAIGAIFAVLIALFAVAPITAFYAIIVICVVQLIDNLWCQPKILGGQVGLRPIYVLIAVITGQSFFGPVGMLLAIPVCACLKLVSEDYLSYRLRKKGLNERLRPLTDEDDAEDL
jgi:predicted PurR-regulated permease PerM